MYDLLITNGTVVDGTGTDRRQADIAITDGVIVAVGSDLDGEAAENRIEVNKGHGRSPVSGSPWEGDR